MGPCGGLRRPRWLLPALLIGCLGADVDPWEEALEAYHEARAASPDYTTPAYDEVLQRLAQVPPEHPHRLEAQSLARVLRAERAVVARTGLELVPGPPIEVEVELIETEVQSETSSATP